jgi:hypothetical protein
MYSRGIVARSTRIISTRCDFPWRLCSVPLKVFFLTACDYLTGRGALSEVKYSCLSPDINEKLSHKMLEEMAVIPVKITHQALNNLR